MSTKWSTQVQAKSGATNFGDLLKDEYAIFLLHGKNVFGDIVYCYVKVSLPNIKKLQLALQSSENFNASDYGEVVAAGKGDPSDEVRAEIALTYPMLEQPTVMRIPAPPAIQADIPMEKKAWDEY